MKKTNYNQQNRGYVNQAFAVTESEVLRQSKSYGKNYASIDFAFNPDLKESDFPMKNSMEIGSIIIGHTEIELTKAEAQKIMQTLETAIQSTAKRYRLGILD